MKIMEDRQQQKKDAELIAGLKSLPLQNVPPDLTDRVMERISTGRSSLLKTILNYLGQTQTVSFRPVYALSMLLVICGAFFIGRFSQPVSQTPASLPAPASQLLPAMIEVPQSAYLVGRGLLQTDGSHELALAFLKRASMLEPENPEFAYWEGVGNWVNGNLEQERQSYLRGLEANPADLPLLINLGHSYLGEKRYHEALDAYRTVLASRPAEPSALYNSGLIYRALGMRTDEISSWKSYLQANREGRKAYRAVNRLHAYGDYTFRDYRIGQQHAIINQQKLLNNRESAPSQSAELADIVTTLEQDQTLNLEVVVFIENDLEAARETAVNIKKQISAISSAGTQGRVGVSWFDVPETIQKPDGGQDDSLSEGLLLFTHRTKGIERGTSI